MKKILSVLVMLLFLVSIVGSAFADGNGNGEQGNGNNDTVVGNGNGNSDNSSEGAADASSDDGTNNGNQDETNESGSHGKPNRNNSLRNQISDAVRQRNIERQQNKNLTQEQRKGIQEKWKEITDKIKEERNISLEKLKEFRQNVLDNREKRVEALKNYHEVKGKLLGNKEKVLRCKATTVDSKECKIVKDETFNDSKQLLLNTIDNGIAKIEELKGNIESDENLNDTQAADLTAKLDSLVTQLNDIRAKIDATTTPKELSDDAHELNTLLKSINSRFVLAAYIHAHNGIDHIIAKAELVGQRVQVKIDGINDTAENAKLQGMLDNYNALVAEAKTHSDNADAAFKTADDMKWNGEEPAAVKESVKTGQDELKLARDKIKEAYDVMKDIVKELKSFLGSNNLDLPDASVGEASA